MASVKCSRSETKMMPHQNPTYLEDIATKMENRRSDLLHRQEYLSDKIKTLERSIPALMAYNLLMTDPTCDDAPFCKLQEIMKKIAPYSDPTEKLLRNIRKTVDDLQGETAELHEQIIDTDVKLEETEMQMESVLLANMEMVDRMEKLEKEVKSYTTPSLHSIHSEDLIYLSKLRHLAKEELNLKRCIKDLEKRETAFGEQIDRLLTSKEFRTMCGDGKPSSCRGYIPLSSDRTRQKVSTACQKETASRKEKRSQQQKSDDARAKSSSWLMNWWNGNRNTSQTDRKTRDQKVSVSPDFESYESTKPCVCRSLVTASCNRKGLKSIAEIKTPKTGKQNSHHRCVPLKTLNGRTICTCDLALLDDIDYKKLFTDYSKSKMSCPSTPPFDTSNCFASDIGRSQTHDARNPCNIRIPNETCKPTVCKANLQVKTGTCRCSCKGKCAMGLSDVPCNCSSPCSEEKGYQPKPSSSLNTDELCECCPCAYEEIA